MNQPRIFRTFLATGVVFSVVLTGVWYWLGRSAFEKIATVLAQPCGVLWYAFLCTRIISLRHAGRRLGFLTFLLFLGYTTIGNGFFAEAITRSLEAEYYTATPLQEQPFDVVILLGGGAAAGGNGRNQGNSSGDRLILTAQLYHAGLAPKIVCTGTRIASMDSTDMDPGQRSAEVLAGLGVPESAIVRIEGRTTSEEMVGIKKAFGDDMSRIGLVTSAWHLPRAMRLATRNGLTPVPLPADFQSGPARNRTTGEKINMCIPQADAFLGVARMTKEYMGMAVGR